MAYGRDPKAHQLLEESDLHEIEVARWWGLGRVRLTKNSTHHAAPGAANGHGTPAARSSRARRRHRLLSRRRSPWPPVVAGRVPVRGHQVPMVGDLLPVPGRRTADPYVEVGQVVDVGQTVCIVEAMKLMNEIEADAAGESVAIKVDNKQPVEYGQVLFLIDPQG